MSSGHVFSRLVTNLGSKRADRSVMLPGLPSNKMAKVPSRFLEGRPSSVIKMRNQGNRSSKTECRNISAKSLSYKMNTNTNAPLSVL